MVIILVSCKVQNNAKKGTQTIISKEIKEEITRRVNDGINPAIVIGVIDSNNSEIFSYGTTSLNSKDTVNQHTIFEIGSITKTFTGVLLSHFVRNTSFTLNSPLSDLLPNEIKAPSFKGDTIKLVHLLNHTSGLPNVPNNFSPANPSNPFADYSNDQLFEFLNSYNLPRAVGKEYEYSNTATALIGQLLAMKNNSNYEKLMLEKIAIPLEFENTKITLTEEMRGYLALGHDNGQQVQNWDFPSFEGAGGIKSNMIDMLKYLSANMGNKKNDLYQVIRITHENTVSSTIEQQVGLGWHIEKTDDSEIIWHNGGTGGYRTYIGFDTKQNKGVVVLSNSTQSVDDIGIHVLNPNIPLNE